MKLNSFYFVLIKLETTDLIFSINLVRKRLNQREFLNEILLDDF